MLLVLIVSFYVPLKDIRGEIMQIHQNRTDNEVRYLKAIVSKEYPEGNVAIQRRNKKTKLVDVVILGKKLLDGDEEQEEEEGGDARVQSSVPNATVPKKVAKGKSATEGEPPTKVILCK